ncbi:hypothetical protein GCM10023187_55370 [Nibrella viscosa]|uniref:histidine kinase n=1 Tax=Nibrella viscosa TaxID=1084524 RepID=A0ABP8L1D3_9BACT
MPLTALDPAQVLSYIQEGAMTAILYCEPIFQDEQVIDFQYVWGNQKASEYSGLLPGQLRQSTMLEIFPNIRTSGIFSRYVQAWEQNQPQRFEREYVMNDRVWWLDVSVIRQGKGIVITALDITASKEIRRQLQQQTAVLQTIVDYCPSGLMLLDAVRNPAGDIIDFRYMLTNPANAQVTGLSVEQMTGRLLLDLFPGSYSEGMFQRIVEVTETGEIQQFEHHYQGDDMDVWINATIVKINDNQTLFTFQDITTLKQQQLALREQAQLVAASNQELKKSNEDLERFAYVASHDMKAPLRKIKAFADILRHQQQEQWDERTLDFIDRIQKSAAQLMGLVDGLLQFSIVSNWETSFLVVSLEEIMAEVLTHLQLPIDETGATITWQNLPRIIGNPILLSELFQNLIANALKYRHPDRRPVISISGEQITGAELPDRLNAVSDPNGPAVWWQITVADNGIGFDMKYQDEIFHPFRRLHTQRDYEGIGIGLATVKRITEKHRGYITVQSRPGAGTSFYLYLKEYLIV